MSVAISRCVWEGSRARGGQLLVLLALADCADDSGIAWPSPATLARRTRLRARQVRRCLRALERLGELEIRPAHHGRRRLRVYRVMALERASLSPDRWPFQLDEPFTADLATLQLLAMEGVE